MDKEKDIEMQENNFETFPCTVRHDSIPVDNPKPEGDVTVDGLLNISDSNEDEIFDEIARGLFSIKQGLRSITEELECMRIQNQTNDLITDETNRHLCSISILSNLDTEELTNSDQEEGYLSDSFVTANLLDRNNCVNLVIVSELLNIKYTLIGFQQQISSVQTQLSSIQEQLSSHKKSTYDSEATYKSEKCKSKKKWKLF
ncbi:hypothetical protein CHUAL_007404 [Chamberlinius hualienensis]